MTNHTETETTAPLRVEGYICMTRDQRWGWGATPEEAVKAARKAGSRNSAKGNRGIYRLPLGAVNAYVDQMGTIAWDWAEDYEGDRHTPGELIEKPRD